MLSPLSRAVCAVQAHLSGLAMPQQMYRGEAALPPLSPRHPAFPPDAGPMSPMRQQFMAVEQQVRSWPLVVFSVCPSIPCFASGAPCVSSWPSVKPAVGRCSSGSALHGGADAKLAARSTSSPESHVTGSIRRIEKMTNGHRQI